MKELLAFFLTKDGLVAIATFVLLGVVSHFNTERPEINFVARTGNLLVFLYIIWRAAGQQIATFFANRRNGIATELEQLEQRKREAERNLNELEARLVSIEAERAAILENSRQQAETLRESILAQAEAEATAIREQARRTAGTQTSSELAALRAELADEIAMAVQSALRTGLTSAQHSELIENSLKKVVLH